MLNEFKQYLLGIGKSENTALNYCDKVKLYFKWCLDSFGSEPQQLYRANVLDYISYMKTIKRYSPKSVNNHLSSLRSFNEFLIFSGRQTELAIVKNDFMKIQTQYANPCTVEQKDVEAFRQRLLEGGNKRDFAIVTLYTYTGIRRSECVNLRLDQINLIAKEIYVVGKGDKQRTVYLNDKTVHAIREYLKVRNSDSPYLFVSRQSEKMAASRINQIFNQYGKTKPIYNLEYFLNRMYALNRDKMRCRICGKPIVDGDDYHAHHIRKNLPLSEINRVSNLASTHRSCHKLVHGQKSKDGFSPKAVRQAEKYRKKLLS